MGGPKDSSDNRSRRIKSQLSAAKLVEPSLKNLIKFSWISIGRLRRTNQALLFRKLASPWWAEGPSKLLVVLRDPAFLMNLASLTKESVLWKRRTSGSPRFTTRFQLVPEHIECFTAKTSTTSQIQPYPQKSRKCRCKPLSTRSRTGKGWSSSGRRWKTRQRSFRTS